MTLFIDSWGWITLACKKDPCFEQVSSFYRKQTGLGNKPLTSDYILSESMTFIFARFGSEIGLPYFEGIFESIRLQNLKLIEINSSRFDKAWGLRKRYKDKPKISFTDLTSFVVMQEMGISSILTNDHHFEQVGLGFKNIGG